MRSRASRFVHRIRASASISISGQFASSTVHSSTTVQAIFQAPSIRWRIRSWRLRSSPVSLPIWSKVTQATLPSTTTLSFSQRTRPAKARFSGNRATILPMRAAIASQPSSTRTPSEAQDSSRRACGDCTQWLAQASKSRCSQASG